MDKIQLFEKFKKILKSKQMTRKQFCAKYNLKLSTFNRIMVYEGLFTKHHAKAMADFMQDRRILKYTEEPSNFRLGMYIQDNKKEARQRGRAL